MFTPGIAARSRETHVLVLVVLALVVHKHYFQITPKRCPIVLKLAGGVGNELKINCKSPKKSKKIFT